MHPGILSISTCGSSCFCKYLQQSLHISIFCAAELIRIYVKTGRCEGTIIAPIEGRGFGWDSIFVPDGETEPFSCMETEKKCEISHRSNAVVQWADWLAFNVDELWQRQQGRPAIGHKGLDFKASKLGSEQ